MSPQYMSRKKIIPLPLTTIQTSSRCPERLLGCFEQFFSENYLMEGYVMQIPDMVAEFNSIGIECVDELLCNFDETVFDTDGL